MALNSGWACTSTAFVATCRCSCSVGPRATPDQEPDSCGRGCSQPRPQPGRPPAAALAFQPASRQRAMTGRRALLVLVAAAALSAVAPAAAEGRPGLPLGRRLAQLGFPKPSSCDELSENDFTSAFTSLDASCPLAEPWSCEGACFDGMHTVSAAAAMRGSVWCVRTCALESAALQHCRPAFRLPCSCVPHESTLPACCSSTISVRMRRRSPLLRPRGLMQRRQRTGCEQCSLGSFALSA